LKGRDFEEDYFSGSNELNWGLLHNNHVYIFFNLSDGYLEGVCLCSIPCIPQTQTDDPKTFEPLQTAPKLSSLEEHHNFVPRAFFHYLVSEGNDPWERGWWTEKIKWANPVMQSLVLALSAGKGGKSYHFALNSDWLKASWGTGEFGVHSLAKELPTFFSRPSIKSCTKLINTCVVAKFKKRCAPRATSFFFFFWGPQVY